MGFVGLASAGGGGMADASMELRRSSVLLPAGPCENWIGSVGSAARRLTCDGVDLRALAEAPLSHALVLKHGLDEVVLQAPP